MHLFDQGFHQVVSGHHSVYTKYMKKKTIPFTFLNALVKRKLKC